MFSQFLKSLDIIQSTNLKKCILVVFLQIIVIFLELFSFTLIIPVVSILIDPTKKQLFEKIPFFMDLTSNQIILYIVIFLIILTLIKVIGLLLIEKKTQIVLKNINLYLSKKIYFFYIFSPWKEIVKKDHSDILRNVLSDTNLFVNQGIYRYILLTKNLILLTSFSIYLFILKPLPTIVILFFFTLITLIYFFFIRKRSENLSLKIRELETLRHKNVSDSLFSLRELKLINNDNFFINNFISSENNFYNTIITQQIMSKVPRFLLEIFVVFGIGLSILLAIETNQEIIDLIPVLSLYFIVIIRFIPVFIGINTDIQTIKYSKHQIDEVILNIKKLENFKNNLNHHSGETNSKINNKQILFFNKSQNTIEIKNLSFSYSKSLPLVFKNLDFKINDGQMISLEGKNGSGKSTFVDLISGLLEPDEGDISLNGKSIFKDIKSWQSKIGYVSQNSFLSNDSIKDNIIFGRKNLTNDHLNKVIKLTNLNDVLNNLPEGIDTKIGSLGKFLSGGQKQRIIISRALIEDPSIIILDEATSALDLYTETSFINLIKKIKENKLIFVISHSENIQKFCDVRFEILNNKLIKK